MTCNRCGQPRVRRYCRICRNAYQRQKRKRHSQLTAGQRLKANCRSYTNVLVRRGKLTREPCACGAVATQKHHPDYGDPRRVEWVCDGCHRERHRHAGKFLPR